MTPRPLASFLARLIWLCMTPLLLLAVWLAWDSLREQEAKHLREGANLARNFAASIDQRLEARINALNMLAVSPLVDDPARWPELYAEAQGYRQSFGVHVIFADHERQMLFNTRQPYGAKLPRLPDSKGKTAAPMALATGQPQVGDIVVSPIDGKLLVAIAVPVSRAGQPTRLILSIFETSRFQPRLDALALPPGWSIALQDSTGADIARRSPPGFDAARDVDVSHRFVVRSQVSPWAVVLEIPRKSHWDDFFKALVALAVGIALATLLGFFGGRLASRRLSREMQALSAPPGPARAASGIAEIAAACQALDAAAEARATTEATLREREHRLEAIVGYSPSALSLKRPDGRYALANPNLQRIHHLSEEEIIGKTDFDLYPEATARVFQANDRLILETMARHSIEEIVPVDGVPRIYMSHMFPVLDDAGQAEYICRIALDITEKKQAERELAAAFEAQKAARLAALNQMEDANAARHATEMAATALRESEARFRRLFHEAPLPLCYVDRNGVLTDRNRRFNETFGYSHEELRTLDDWWPLAYPDPAYREWVLATWSAAVAKAAESKRDIEPIEYQVHCQSGESRNLMISGISIGEDFLATFFDVTERRQAEETVRHLNASLEQRVAERTVELTAANRELDAFAYAVSHDLRAPLRAMNGFAQALEEDYGERLDGDAKSYLDQIGLASRRMGDLIEGILTLSRSTRGELRRDAVDLSVLARRCLEGLARQEPLRQVEWQVTPNLSAEGDARMLEAVLNNLIDNAWKYSAGRDPAHIRFFSEVRGGQTWFCVSDDGAGFDPAHAARLFQPFQRLHRQDEFPGLGIGLATVARIVHRHGGEIEASGAVGQGATFCFTLTGGTDEG